MGIEGEEFQVRDRKYLQQIIEEPFLNLTEEKNPSRYKRFTETQMDRSLKETYHVTYTALLNSID